MQKRVVIRSNGGVEIGVTLAEEDAEQIVSKWGSLQLGTAGTSPLWEITDGEDRYLINLAQIVVVEIKPLSAGR